MIIYIYGSEGFKKDIHEVLEHSNIKFRLDEHGEIVDLETLEELKDAIEDNPTNIYLIDDSKIIKKNSLNQKIKFLIPKDGIEQEYLLDHGIGDLSVDSIEELSKHIIKKLEAVIPQEDPDLIQESIVEIVEDAYEKDDEDESCVQLDDELSALLSAHNTPNDDTNEEIGDVLSEIESIEDIEISDESNSIDNEVNELQDLSFDEDFDNIEIKEEIIEKKENNHIDKVSQGENMADEFSEFDTLSENDILAALDGLDNVSVSNDLKQTPPKAVNATSSNESLDISSSSSDDIAKLISQLLNNKTLEITIKVKD